jgi:hypothetical protein
MPQPLKKDVAGYVSASFLTISIGLTLLTPLFYVLLVYFLGERDGWGKGIDYGQIYSDPAFLGLSLLTGFGYSTLTNFIAFICALSGVLRPFERRRVLSRRLLWITGFLTAAGIIAFILTLP